MTRDAHVSRGDGLAAPPSSTLGRIIRRFSWLSVGETVRTGLHAATTVMLARALGAEVFGIYGFAVGIVHLLLLPIDGGLSVLGTRDIGRGPGVIERYVPAVLGFRLVIAGVGWFMLAGGAFALAPTPRHVVVLVLGGASLVTAALSLEWIFYGVDRARPVAGAGMLRAATFATGVALLVGGPEHLWRVPLLQVGAELAGIAVLARAYHQQRWPLRLRIGWSACRPLLQEAWPVGLGLLMRAASLSTGAIVLGLLRADREVGWFVAGHRFVLVVLSFSTLYFMTALPANARAHQEGIAAARALLDRSLGMTAQVTMPFAAGVTLLAPEIVALLYGAGYEPTAIVLRVLAWLAPVTVIATHFRQGLLAAGQQVAQLRALAAGAAAGVLLTLTLAPALGMLGPAIGTLAAELAALLIGRRLLERHLGLLTLWPAVGPPLIASLGMLLVALVMRGSGWLAAALGGGAAYGLLLGVAGRVAPRVDSGAM